MRSMKVSNQPTIRRMPSYLHKLLKMRMEGRTHISSSELADYMSIEWIVVRRDIALTGIKGQRRVGYNINELIQYIREYIGWTKPMTATLIGAGALGSAILGHDDFRRYGLQIESVFDCDTDKIGKEIHGHEIYDIATIRTRLKINLPKIAILCVSNSSAQLIADQLVSLGIKFIWNFASTCLKVPPGVVVQREILAGGLAMLGVKIKNQESQHPIEIEE